MTNQSILRTTLAIVIFAVVGAAAVGASESVLDVDSIDRLSSLEGPDTSSGNSVAHAGRPGKKTSPALAGRSAFVPGDSPAGFAGSIENRLAIEGLSDLVPGHSSTPPGLLKSLPAPTEQSDVVPGESPARSGAPVDDPVSGERSDIIPGRYIVVFKDSVTNPGSLARAQVNQRGGKLGFVYRHALAGYSAGLSKGAAEALRRNPLVKSVRPVREATVQAQEVPTGVERIYGTQNEVAEIDGEDERVDVDVAVIDTGIDYDHPDLNVVGRTDCVPSGEDTEEEFEECVDEAGDDGHGHGSHVAGTIGALDNDKGVVGVAPGARLWAVRALSNNGSGSFEWIFGAIDWVTATREDEDPENDIDVANMSIGCNQLPCVVPELSEALTKSAEAGIVYAIAAGNQSADVSAEKTESSFATAPHTITVSALADYDGKPGGESAPTCNNYDSDDELASFSNYGEDVEVAAPGVCVYSTWKNGGYSEISGTSMASPHVAGAAALRAGQDPPEDLEDVEAIREAIEADGNLQWTDDSPDEVQEPLLDVGRVVTEPAEIESESEVTLHGRVRPVGSETSYRFEYGESAEDYEASVPIPDAEIEAGSGYVELSETLEGLQGQTTYHYRIVGIYGEEETIYGQARAFGTTPPTATTGDASEVRGNDAVLGATVNPKGSETSYWFEWGPTSEYGSKVPLAPESAGAGTEDIEVSVPVGPLMAEQTYHFRVVADNTAGTVYGEDRTLTTPAAEWGYEFPSGLNELSSLSDVSCIAPGECMVVGGIYDPPALETRWSGLLKDGSWSLSEIPRIGELQFHKPHHLSCSSAQWCVAVGYRSAGGGEEIPQAQSWDGEKWAPMQLSPLPTHAVNGTLGDVSCTSSSFCVAVGTYRIPQPSVGLPYTVSRHLIERWDGSEWSRESLDLPGTSLGSLGSVSCVSPSACVAVGSRRANNSWYRLATRWDGEDWEVIQDTTVEGVQGNLNDVSCASAASCMAVGTLIEGEAETLAPEHWDGESWESESGMLPGTVDGYHLRAGLDCPSPSRCVAAGQLMHSTSPWTAAIFSWDGTGWSYQSSDQPVSEGGEPLGHVNIRGVSCTTSSSCVGTMEAWNGTKYELGLQTYNAPGPEAVTNAATSVKTSSATLKATVNPEGAATTYQFEYGETKAYGSKAPASAEEAGSGESDLEVAEKVTGLEPATTYHYRVLATNAEGTSYGQDRRFTTRAPPPSFASSFGELGEEGQLNEPGGIAVDPEGDIWVADSGNSRIEKFSPDGELLLQSGGKGTGEGQFAEPQAVALDPEGSVWVADSQNHRIVELSPEGAFVQAIGWGVADGESEELQSCESGCHAGIAGSGAGQLNQPRGISPDPEGNIWVVNTAGNTVAEFDAGGEYLSQFTVTGENEDIAIDAGGEVWLVDSSGKVKELSPEGELLLEFGTEGSGEGQFKLPGGIGIDSEGNVWVADSGNDRAQEFNPEGEYLAQFGKTGSGEGQMQLPRDVAFDPEGDVWVADSGNNRIQEWSYGPSAVTETATAVTPYRATLNATIDTQGLETTYQFEYGETTSYGSLAPAAAKSLAAGAGSEEVAKTIKELEPETTYHFRVVASNAAGETYGADRTFTTHTALPTFAFAAGSGGSEPGQFSIPSAIAADAEGDVWIVDGPNRRVERFNSEGEYLSQFGSKGTGNGQFNQSVGGIAVNSGGHLFVSGDSRVQKFNSEGEYLSQFGSNGSGDGEFSIPKGVATNAENGDIYVVDKGNDRVQKFNSEGEYLSQFGSTGSGDGNLDEPWGIAIDQTSGDIYVVDTGNNRIEKFDAGGEYLSEIGPAGEGSFTSPTAADGVAVDGDGNVWAADTANHRLQVFSPEGDFLGWRGGYGEGDGEFRQPNGLSVDLQGNVWASDAVNKRIQKWSYPATPEASTEAASEVGITEATLNATVYPEGLPTTYYFEYGPTEAYGSKAPVSAKSVGAGGSAVAVSEDLSELSDDSSYHYRIVAESDLGTAYGEDETLTTLKKPPKATTGAATEITAESATLNGTVNPEGLETTYQFEYVDQASFEASGYESAAAVPASPKGVGSGTEGVAVEEPVNELVYDTTYHFRVVATSVAATVYGEDKTFETARATWQQPLFDAESHPVTIAAAQSESEPFELSLPLGKLTCEVASLEGEASAPSQSIGLAAEFSQCTVGSGWRDATVEVNSCHLELSLLNAGPPYAGNLGIGCQEEGDEIVIEAEGVTSGTCTITYAVQEGGAEGVSLENFGEGSERGIDSGFDKAPLTANFEGGFFACGTSNGEHTTRLSGEFALQGVDGEEPIGVFVTEPDSPQGTTEEATEITAESATLNGKVNPKGLVTTYQFQYVDQAEFEASGYESATAVPASPEGIGSGSEDVAVDETIEGLEPGTAYHFRVVATNEAGSAQGEDEEFTTEGAADPATLLEEMAATEFYADIGTYNRFESLWLKPGWAANKGQYTKWAWGPHSGSTTPSGAYYDSPLSAEGGLLAVAATLLEKHPNCGCPPLPGNEFSLWLDMPDPSEAEEAGYELRFTRLEAADRYDVELSKWAGGEETELGSKANYTFEEGDSLALVDQGGAVSAWTDTGSGYGELLSAEDATYSGGKAGLSGTGLNARLQDFKATALTPPKVTTEAASEVKQTSATLNGTVNPEGLATEYRFQWASDAEFEAEGYAHETVATEAGSGAEPVAASAGLEGLEPGITYHFRAVAESEAGTVWGKDKTFKTEAASGPGAIALTEPFDGSAESLERFGSQWSALGWAEGETPKGRDMEDGWAPADGWAPSEPYATRNGAYHEATLADEGGGLAVAATVVDDALSFIGPNFSLWLDMPDPSEAERAGYELRITNVYADGYEATLSKWVGGEETVLASKKGLGYSFEEGTDAIALADEGDTVAALADTGSGFEVLLSAEDSTYTGGKAGLAGSGTKVRLADFRAGEL